MIGKKFATMNNTGKKIVILGIVIAIAIASILAFYPTIVAPPKDVMMYNLHRASLEANINKFSALENTAFNDAIYNVVVDKLSLYRNEGFMSEEEIDYQTIALAQKYIPIFKKLCDSKFSASSWRDSDHNAMLNRIDHLRSLRVDYGYTKVVTGSNETSLSDIETIIINYREAKKAASYSTFHSINDANKKIQDAQKYLRMYPLSNCTDLTNKLSKVKSNIGNSHYYQVESKINQMANYGNMTEESFNSLMSIANNMIQEYDSNRSRYGSNAKTTESIKQKAAEYYRNAKEYFSHKGINIFTNDQWTSMTSPSSSYRAYMSSSNYNKHDSKANMYFTIRGYSTFTFYIRSNGESNCDYVIVGKDSIPTINSNYANTKGSPSSGTNIYNYKPVTLDNLDRTSTYTIYVTYTKDISINEGTDRGYLLIPYENN